MNLPDGSLLELINYNFPSEKRIKIKQKSNQLGVSHIAFNVSDIEDFCNYVIKLGGDIVNKPALTDNQRFKVAYCHGLEGNLFKL